MTDYTGFSGDPELQSGNYLALKCSAVEGATVKVELLGGVGGEVELDADMNIVLRITDKDTQSVKVTGTKGSVTETKTFSLAGLTVETE